MANEKDNLLRAVLGCGTDDLEMLEDVHCDFYDVIEQLDGRPLQEVGFNGLMRAVVDVGIIHIRDAVDDRRRELEAIQTERELDEDEAEEYRLLGSLDPDKDIRSYHNCLETNAWFENNGKIYRTYLSDAIDSFEESTGLPLTGGD